MCQSLPNGSGRSDFERSVVRSSRTVTRAKAALPDKQVLYAVNDLFIGPKSHTSARYEIRHGELAQLGILPFQPYYGTHDATSLYVIVMSYLYQWLGDENVLRRYLPNAEAALRWIDRHGDRLTIPGFPEEFGEPDSFTWSVNTDAPVAAVVPPATTPVPTATRVMAPVSRSMIDTSADC